MLIEDVDALKAWLGKSLQPICDADPIALARYVVALVKKDKQEEELRNSCFEQLDVFLQDKTKGFVAQLFEVLKTKSYIQATNNGSPALPPPSSNSNAKPEPRKSSRSEESSDDHRRKRSRSRSPIRDKYDSRDRDRSRRYDDRRRSDDRNRHSRYDSDYRSRHRSRSRSRSPRSPRSRSPRHRSHSLDRSKHKSRSPERIPVHHHQSNSRGSTPTQDDTKEHEPSSRGPAINSEVIVPSHSGYHDRERPPARPPPRPRCRDYDEKGFCMRGDLCPYDHGVDPVVLDDVVIPFASGGPPPHGSGPRGPSPGPPGGPPPRGPPGGPPRGPPHGHRPGPPHDPRGPPPSHHMPPIPPDHVGPRPPRPMMHHGPPPPRPPHPPPTQQGQPRPPPPPPPHPGDHVHIVVPAPPGVDLPLAPVSVPSDFHPLPPRSQQLPPQPGPTPPLTTQSIPKEYQPEPYNPEAPMLRPNPNDFWRGHGRGRGRGGHDRGYEHNHEHGHDSHPRDRINDRDIERDRMRHPFPPPAQQPRRDLVSIPTIPEPSEEEHPPGVSPQHSSREGGMLASRVVVPTKRKYELDNEDEMEPYEPQHLPPPVPQHHPGMPPQQGPPPPPPPHHQAWHGNPGHMAKKPHFDFKRLGPPRRPHPNSDNCTLELRRVPREHNNIAKLNEHFSKFGHIVNLQVCYNGDGEAALITFLNNAQAASAYRSTEPILNNRFIKVFWHKPPAEDGNATENAAPKEAPKVSIKDRLGEIPPPHKLQLNNNKTAKPNPQKVTASPLGLTKTVFNPTALKKGSVTTRLGAQTVQAAAQQQIKQRQAEQKQRQQLQAGLVQKKKQQEQEMMKKKMAIQKEKQLLLHKQIDKQKLLIAKLENSKGMAPEQKTKIMKAIKTLADIIEKLKTDLTVTAPKPKPAPVKTLPKTKLEAQKEILDTELDIIAKQNEGADTSALRRRVAALKKEATVLGLLGRGGGVMRGGRGGSAVGKRGGRGRGAAMRGGRGGARTTTLSVDRRPKQLLVTGFEAEDKDSVVELLSKDGGVETVIHDDSAVTMVITYQTRPLAEQAIATAAQYEKGALQLSWYKPGAGAEGVTAPQDVQDEVLLTEVTGQVLSRHNSVTGEGELAEEEEETTVLLSEAGAAQAIQAVLDDDDEEDVLRVGEGEDDENMPAGIDEPELDDDMDEDLLLGVDEEEDEEEEGRSWRR